MYYLFQPLQKFWRNNCFYHGMNGPCVIELMTCSAIYIESMIQIIWVTFAHFYSSTYIMSRSSPWANMVKHLSVLISVLLLRVNWFRMSKDFIIQVDLFTLIRYCSGQKIWMEKPKSGVYFLKQTDKNDIDLTMPNEHRIFCFSPHNLINLNHTTPKWHLTLNTSNGNVEILNTQKCYESFPLQLFKIS